MVGRDSGRSYRICYTFIMSWLFKNRKFLYATSVLIGTMVGVGVFGIPLAFSKSGFLVGVGLMVAIAAAMLLTYFMYAEVVLRTEAPHQLVGYTGKYLGPWWKKFMLFADTLSIYGGLLAYIIIAGDFLNYLFSGFYYATPSFYSILFFAVFSILIYLGFRTIAWLEIGLVGIYCLVIFVTFIFGLPKIHLPNLMTFSPGAWFLPYGVLLFAFAGMSAIPLQRKILTGQEENLKKSIGLAVAVVAILYLLFAFTIVGIVGEATPDTVSGLFEFIGGRLVFLIVLFGILAVSTSYLTLGLAMFDVFRLDYKLKSVPAWLLVILPPFILYLSGLRTFVDVINIAGAAAIAPISLIIIATFAKAKGRGDRVPEYSVTVPKWLMYILILIFLGGAIYALAFN